MKKITISEKLAKEANERLKDTERELQEIRAILESEKPKKPWYGLVEGQKYWMLDFKGAEDWFFDSETSEVDASNIARANVFHTKEEAKKADERRLALGRIVKYICENDIKSPWNGWEVEWEDENDKYQITGWSYDESEPTSYFFTDVDISAHNLVFESGEEMDKVLENCAKDLEILLKK